MHSKDKQNINQKTATNEENEDSDDKEGDRPIR